MKKINSLLSCSLIASCLAIGLISTGCRSKAANKTSNNSSPNEMLNIPALLERKGELANATEWQMTKEKVTELNQKIAIQPNDLKSRLQLATIYIAEARITGEHPYYYPAILKILDGILALDNKNFDATIYKASVKLSQHKFEEARSLAEKALAINPANAYIYGILVDANVELGNYDVAVTMSDKMQALKPSLESYSRASYLREIYGDYPGAIDAMKMAVNAGLPGSEPQSWAKRTLGQLYEETGKWAEAEKEYNEILALRPSYAFAIEGLARVEKSRKSYNQALDFLDKAAVIMPEYSFHEEMASIFELTGDEEKAQDKYKEVIRMLQEDESSGHSISLEICNVYIKTGEFEKALEYARKEFTLRPLNIEVNSALAWISFKMDDFIKAKEHLKIATRTGSQDPELLKRKAVIEKAG